MTACVWASRLLPPCTLRDMGLVYKWHGCSLCHGLATIRWGSRPGICGWTSSLWVRELSNPNQVGTSIMSRQSYVQGPQSSTQPSPIRLPFWRPCASLGLVKTKFYGWLPFVRMGKSPKMYVVMRTHPKWRFSSCGGCGLTRRMEWPWLSSYPGLTRRFQRLLKELGHARAAI
ncbi:hypothetical protein VNO77_15259 [Canavalia gladiata]|uniref:Uncharacterized protein n=1 Tax=Canavalia gladiata TaxID=3824 RepID=A0AAN9QVS0_CANGL